MKTQFHLPLCLLIATSLGACTSVKRDDHSYTYIYQHNPGPQRQVLETVTTQSTRTRRYSTPDDSPLSPLPSSDQPLPQTEESNAPDLRSDPIPPPPRRGPYLGGFVPSSRSYFEEPPRIVGPQYEIPAPVSYYRPTPVVYDSPPVGFTRPARVPSVSYSAQFALTSVRSTGGMNRGVPCGNYVPPTSVGRHCGVGRGH